MNEKNYDLIILFSGGADSRLMLEFALSMDKNPLCLLINYDQKHNDELSLAKKQLTRLAIDYQTVKIFGLNLNSALTGDGIRGRFGDNISEWHVPGRNTIFASIAFSIAENLGVDEIWLGSDYSDIENNFVDCKQDFILKVNELFKVNGVNPIKFRAPLLGLDKNQVNLFLDYYEVDDEEIFSGYGDLEENNSDNNCEFTMDYKSYITLPTIIEIDGIVPPGVYRKEGYNPLESIYGYGIIFDINDPCKIDLINNYKKTCRIIYNY